MTTSTTPGSTTSTTLDPFQCYEIRPPGPFGGVTVDLVDRFWAWNSLVRKAYNVCAPANLDDTNPLVSLDGPHLSSYGTRASEKFTRRYGLEVTNTLGTLFLDVVKPARLLVPTTKSLTGPAGAPPTGLDHFACYKARRSKGTAKFVRRLGTTIVTQFESVTVDVVKPIRLCFPVDKNGEDPGAPTHPDALLCYRVRGRTGFPTTTVWLNNQFGPQTYSISQRRELCVPSLLGPGGGSPSGAFLEVAASPFE